MERGDKDQMLHHAKALRSNQTEAEARLWYHLRAHRFMGLKFKRQKPVGRYIVDFVCGARRLIIELDSGQHAEQEVYDKQRDAWLRSKGIRCCASGTMMSCNSWKGYWSRYAATSPLVPLTRAISPSPSPTSVRAEPGSSSPSEEAGIVPSPLQGEG